MKYMLDAEIASIVGSDAAIIFENFCFWIRHNEANGTNAHDGKFWTYNSRSALSSLFPHLTENQIRTCIKRLEEKGLVVKGCYNKNPYDRTAWYAIGENEVAIRIYETHRSTGEKSPIYRLNSTNELVSNNPPIPDINTDNYPDTKEPSLTLPEEGNGDDSFSEPFMDPVSRRQRKEPKAKKSAGADMQEEIAGYTDMPELRQSLEGFVEMRKGLKKPLTPRALKLTFQKLEQLAGDNDYLKIQILDQSVMNSWQSVYELKVETEKRRDPWAGAI